jgi:hypothetical protein
VRGRRPGTGSRSSAQRTRDRAPDGDRHPRRPRHLDVRQPLPRARPLPALRRTGDGGFPCRVRPPRALTGGRVASTFSRSAKSNRLGLAPSRLRFAHRCACRGTVAGTDGSTGSAPSPSLSCGSLQPQPALVAATFASLRFTAAVPFGSRSTTSTWSTSVRSPRSGDRLPDHRRVLGAQALLPPRPERGCDQRHGAPVATGGACSSAQAAGL